MDNNFNEDYYKMDDYMYYDDMNDNVFTTRYNNEFNQRYDNRFDRRYDNRFDRRYDIIFRKWDLPLPKKPEIQTPILSVGWSMAFE